MKNETITSMLTSPHEEGHTPFSLAKHPHEIDPMMIGSAHFTGEETESQRGSSDLPKVTQLGNSSCSKLLCFISLQ